MGYFQKSTSLAVLLSVLSMASAGNSKPLHWAEHIVVDGKNQEWSSPLPGYDKKTGINFDVVNDDRNLYLILRVVDQEVQQQILSSGLEIWIDPNGKKKKESGITYPLPRTAPPTKEEQPPMNRKSSGEPSDRPDKNLFLVQKELMLTGFRVKNGLQPTTNCPIQTAITMDKSGCMIYELAVPFETFYKDQLDAKDSGLTFSIGFLVPKAKLPSTPNNASIKMQGMGSMGGGPGGGGPGGGGPGGGGPEGSMGGDENERPSQNATTNTEKKYWINVSLSFQNH